MNTLERVKAVIGDHAGLVVSLIGDDQPLGMGEPTTETRPGIKGLEFDSLDRIELAMNLGEHFGIDIPDEDVDRPEMGTAAGIAAYIDGKLALGPDHAAGGAVHEPGTNGTTQGFAVTPEMLDRMTQEDAGPWPLAMQSVEITETNGGDWSPAIEDSTNYTVLSPGDLLAALGTDANKWAVAFMQTAATGLIMDDVFMRAWFANAIEAGRGAGLTQARQAAEQSAMGLD